MTHTSANFITNKVKIESRQSNYANTYDVQQKNTGKIIFSRRGPSFAQRNIQPPLLYARLIFTSNIRRELLHEFLLIY